MGWLTIYDFETSYCLPLLDTESSLYLACTKVVQTNRGRVELSLRRKDLESVAKKVALSLGRKAQCTNLLRPHEYNILPRLWGQKAKMLINKSQLVLKFFGQERLPKCSIMLSHRMKTVKLPNRQKGLKPLEARHL